MTSPIGYNNPAYTHQFDTSLYDYQYVPEIDPDYDGQPDNKQEEIHLVHPSFHEEFSGASEEFDASDESNQSIIVEECNNRRVTLICEKRNKTEQKFYEDTNFKGAYHHNISLDSEEDYRLPQQTRLDSSESNAYAARNRTPQVNPVQYQRNHRYEEIGDYDEVNGNHRCHVTRHRYAEITVDENGYPSIGNEIEVEHNQNGFRIVNNEPERECRPIQKPRAISPVSQTFPLTYSPSKTYQRTVSPHPPSIEIRPPRIPARNMAHNTIEMAELSPPNSANRAKPTQTPFFQSPKRQPPIGASSPIDLQEQLRTNTKSIKNSHKRQNSVTNFKEAAAKKVTPSKSQKTVAQMFQAKATPRAFSPSRRNISCSFTDPPKNANSPYRSTTTELPKAKTAIITPILQRKNGRNETGGSDDEARNFRKMSHLFQSTGNLYKNGLTEYQAPKMSDKARIKRNRSVPNFAQTLSNESKFKYNDCQKVQKSVRKLEYQYSPAKSDRFSPINRSRISLIDQTKVSWSNAGSDFQASTSGCLIIGAVIQIITSLASCAICFYLFSKLGRRYYLDFGILAGFVHFVLGVLGFRSQCWRWLPNRNYVSGYILLTAFSIITCAGFVYLITARPMSGDPILDLMGGGICGVSVLTIILSVTGLTMSGCCKSPPPDNRVNNI